MSEKDIFKDNFDVVDINKLKPFLVRWAHMDVTYKNDFPCDMNSMEDL